MSPEEYNIKLDALRKERDMHQREANRLMKEMDDLESDARMADVYIGKWIKIDRRATGGYLEYFNVVKWEKRPRGVNLYGRGFTVCNYSIHMDSMIVLTWDEIDIPQETTEEEFYKVFDEYVAEIRSTFDDPEYIAKRISKDEDVQKSIIESLTKHRYEINKK